MLVLTRKTQEKIRIGDQIVVTVLRTKGNAVRLGIEAPENVRVLRGEIAFDDAAASDSDQDADQPVSGRTLHARVPRSQVAAVVPHLASGTGPLAAMMGVTAASSK